MNIFEINKIYNEDCLVGIKRIVDSSIDLIITDPPYKTTSRGIGKSSTTGGILKNKTFNSGKPFKIVEIDEYINELYRVLKDTGHCYIMTNNKNLTKFLSVIKKSDFNFIKVLVWDKISPLPNQFYMDRHEYIILLRKGKAVKVHNNSIPSILAVKTVNKRNLDYEKHMTEKPVELMEILVSQSSNENEVVLDPFMGNGTTAIACINTKRNYIGFELDEKYHKIANERILETINKI